MQKSEKETTWHTIRCWEQLGSINEHIVGKEGRLWEQNMYNSKDHWHQLNTGDSVGKDPNYKDREVKWANPKLGMRNCSNITKMD